MCYLSNMYKIKSTLFLLFVLLGMNSCSSDSMSQPEDTVNSEVATVLLFSRLNNFEIEPEEQVHDLTIAVFDAFSKELMYVKQVGVDESMTLNYTLLMGVYDFYFLANVAYQNIDWTSILKVDDLRGLKLYPLWTTAEISEKGIPMVDSLKGVEVIEGGTVESPIAFNSLKNARDIKLLRTMSKLDLTLSGSGFNLSDLSGVASVQLMNVSNVIYPFNLESKSQELIDISLEMLQVWMNEVVHENTVYIPTQKVQNQEGWTSDSEVIPYLKIQLKTGEEFQIPLVSNHKKYWKGIKYLAFAEGTILGPNNERPDYSIHPNTNYQYQLNLEQNKLVVEVKVKPWIYVEINNDDFMKPQYEGATIYLENTYLVSGNKIQIRKNEKTPYFYIWLQKPEGAVWRFNLSNGLNFKLSDSDSSGIANIDSSIGAHFIYVTTRVIPAININPVTEVFFTINDEEIPLNVVLGDGTQLEFFGANRLLIEQVY